VQRTLVRQVFPLYVIVVLLALAATTIFASLTFRQAFYRRSLDQLMDRAEILGNMFVPDAIEEPAYLSNFIRAATRSVETDVSFLNAPGTEAIMGSEASAGTVRSLGEDPLPELEAALDNRVGSDIRRSRSEAGRSAFVAIPILRDGERIAILHVREQLATVDQSLNEVLQTLIVTDLFILLVTALAVFALVRRINEPLRMMDYAARRYAGGDLDFRFSISEPEEVRSLAETLNAMAAQLRTRIDVISGQRNELETILSSMIEGVLLIDEDGTIRNANNAATKLFGLRRESVEGQTLIGALRNSELDRLFQEVIEEGRIVERSVTVYSQRLTHLQVHGTLVSSASGDTAGVLLVLNDITRLKTLENVRKDFVANVSHELKTPITSIKGFIETLIDGAAEDPRSLSEFLHIILNQTNRLNAIIEDLLTLSRLERDNLPVELSEIDVYGLCQRAIDACSSQASQRDVRVHLERDRQDAIVASPSLLEQAVVNLIDNAVKYSDPKSEVSVCPRVDDEEVSIAVVDHGIGIPESEQPRIFERFYRVDKARSRDLGGTGLGLSIVKHICRAHGGEVALTSTPGGGSTFTIRLPRWGLASPAAGLALTSADGLRHGLQEDVYKNLRSPDD
jgi:two-component system phosphate regulon sensor histidine kinase PhoR